VDWQGKCRCGDASGHKVRELAEAQCAVTVSVHSPHDGEQLVLTSKMSDASEESAQVVSIDFALVVAINTSEGSSKGVVISDFEVVSEHILSPGEIELTLKDGLEALLDVNGESVETSDAYISTVETHVAENIVLAGKYHLRKVLEGQASIFVRVEKAYQSVQLTFS